jgi:hypothetical protein
MGWVVVVVVGGSGWGVGVVYGGGVFAFVYAVVLGTGVESGL